MSYRARTAAAAEVAARNEAESRRVLAEQALIDMEAAGRQDRARRELQELAEQGKCTPVERVYNEDEVAEIHEFLDDMAESDHEKAVVFSQPAPEKRSFTKFVIDSVNGSGAPKNGAGNGHQQQWPERQGYVIGTFNHSPRHWTEVQETPTLAVLLTDGTVGAVPSVITVENRIRPNTNAQPLPLIPRADGSYRKPDHGFYGNVLPNVLNGAVDLPADVAEHVQPAVSGAVFMRGDLDATLEAITNGGIRHDTIEVN